MMLFLAFGGILAVTFGAVSLFTASSGSQRVIERRYLGIRASNGENGGGNEAAVLLKLEPSNTAEGIDALLQRFQIIRGLEIQIIQADVKGSPLKFIGISAVLLVAGGVITSFWVNVLLVQLVVALVFAYMPFAYLTFKRSRRLKKFDNCLADAVDMMSRALRAGHAMTAAINIVAEQSLEPVRSEFAEVFKQQNFGLPIRDAMQQMLDRVPSPDLRVVVTGILVQKETGGNLAEILDRTANTIRERLKIQGEIRTHTAQGRLTGYILCCLPIVMLLIINWLNPGYSDVLVQTPTGHVICYVGITLLIIGGLIIRAIINGIEVQAVMVIFYILLGVIMFAVVALLMTPNLFRPSQEAQRFFDVVKTESQRPDQRVVGGRELMQNKLLGAATELRMRLGLAENPKLRNRLTMAGLNGKAFADIFFASQFLLPLAGVVAATLMPSDYTIMCVIIFGVLGYMAPDFWLNWKTGRRRKRIRRSIPDALDLMVICVDAGLGLDQALLRVGTELAVSHPDINVEFTQVNREQRAGRPRLEAWQNLADRTEIEEFNQFVGMLAQTDRFGTPIAKALSRFSEEIRSKRKQHAEEAASKTKIKIIFPLVLCIFPCLFIVLLAPAVLNIMAGLKGM